MASLRYTALLMLFFILILPPYGAMPCLRRRHFSYAAFAAMIFRLMLLPDALFCHADVNNLTPICFSFAAATYGACCYYATLMPFRCAARYMLCLRWPADALSLRLPPCRRYTPLPRAIRRFFAGFFRYYFRLTPYALLRHAAAAVAFDAYHTFFATLPRVVAASRYAASSATSY